MKKEKPHMVLKKGSHCDKNDYGMVKGYPHLMFVDNGCQGHFTDINVNSDLYCKSINNQRVQCQVPQNVLLHYHKLNKNLSLQKRKEVKQKQMEIRKKIALLTHNIIHTESNKVKKELNAKKKHLQNILQKNQSLLKKRKEMEMEIQKSKQKIQSHHPYKNLFKNNVNKSKYDINPVDLPLKGRAPMFTYPLHSVYENFNSFPDYRFLMLIIVIIILYQIV